MAKIAHKVERTCIACRRSAEQADLVRYVCAPDGTLLVDSQHKLPGRGAYTCFSKECISQAVKRKAFTRAMKNVQISVDPERLIESLCEQLQARVLNLVGMSRKANLMASGSQLVISSLQNPVNISWVLMARDVSQGVGSKVRQRCARANVPLIEYFDKVTIGEALGLPERSVVALLKSPLAQAVKNELLRYTSVMGEVDGENKNL